MERVVRAFPVLEGAKQQLKQFLDELQTTRKSETGAFYRKYGVTRETAFLQDTPHGAILIVVTDLDAPDEAFPQYGASQDTFESWFKDRVRQVSGVDLNAEPRGPEARCVFDWRPDGHSADR